MSKKKVKKDKKQDLLNKIFSAAIMELLSLQTLDETTLTYGEAIKVLKHTIHLIREEAQKSEIENKTKESMCVGFEIRLLSRDEWKENLLARDQNGKENEE